MTRIRAEIVQLLGGQCVRCKFSDERALAIDHVGGGGTDERKRLGGSYLPTVLRRVQAGERAYQLLCCNCNEIKKHEQGEHRPRVHQ